MNVTYVARSFLDYRVPVFEALNRLLAAKLSVIFLADYVPQRVQHRVRQALGDNAIGLSGEVRVGPREFAGFANASFRFVYQPGLLRTIAATRPDVVVGDGFFQWTLYALAYRLQHGVPLVVCYERTRHTERHAQWLRRAYRRAVVRRWVDAMSCNGSLSREYAVSLGMPPNRITTGHMAADTMELAREAALVTSAERSAIRASWGAPALAFLFVGRLIARKGLTELLSAWGRVEPNAAVSCRLIIVGTGPDDPPLRRTCQERGLRGVHFHGPADYRTIASLYAAADILVMPTLEDNWSLVVPEAMACGLPILCSIYNGCHPELVRNGENGWLFDPLQMSSLSDALTQAIDHRARLPSMGQASREIVSNHSPEHAAEAILQACEIARCHRASSPHAFPLRP